MKIFRLALERNYSKEKTVSLIQFINFLLVLSEDYELKFNNEIKKLLKVDDMNKVKSYQYNYLLNLFFEATRGEKLSDWEAKLKREKEAAEAKLLREKEAAKKEKEAAKAKLLQEKMNTAKSLLLQSDFSTKKIADIVSIDEKEVIAIKKQLRR